MPTTDSFWPNGARLAISFSLMFEGGGQPISGAPGFFEEPMQKGLPDLATNGVFQYGVYEGIPRILDLMDKHEVKLTSFMIGEAVDKAPDLARDIVRRGHEAAAHGRSWQNSYPLDPDAERRFIADGVESIHKATGQTPVGWNAYFVRNSPHTLDILQSLGFKYHIDEPSADQPFIVKLKGGDFVTVPYTLHMNDIASYTFIGWNPAAYEQALKDEFDQLYEEGVHRRRMMVVGLHDRISGHANRVRVLDRFLTYARSKPSVWFARKDEIADWALNHREITPIYDRGDPTITGLPGSAAQGRATDAREELRGFQKGRITNYKHVIWPQQYDPKTSAIYALNDIDVNTPPEVVWKLLVDAENWSSYFPAEDQVKILSGEPELALGTKWTRVTVGIPTRLIVTEYVPTSRLAWSTVVDGDETGSCAYHGWVITPTDTGCHVLSEETQQGPFFLEELGRKNPGALYRYHQEWVECLARGAEAEAAKVRG